MVKADSFVYNYLSVLSKISDLFLSFVKAVEIKKGCSSDTNLPRECLFVPFLDDVL